MAGEINDPGKRTPDSIRAGEGAPETNTLTGAWARIRRQLRTEFGEAAYKSWLAPLTLESFEGGRVIFSTKTPFLRDWVSTHYGDRLAALWRDEVGGVHGIQVLANGTNEAEDSGNKGVEIPATDTRAVSATANDRDISASLDPRYTFEDFVVGKPNELAYAAALRVAESVDIQFNPLFMHGGVGLGKTHLMHAIAWRIRERGPDRRVAYMSAEHFMYLFVQALRVKDMMSFKQRFRSVDVLMIDDVQFISGKDSTQEEFFHTVNALMDERKQVVISADKSPNDLEGIEERLVSRFNWGLVADVHPTTYELRLSILQNKAAATNVTVPRTVMEFIAHKVQSNVRDVEGALNRVTAHADLIGREITLEMAHEVLRDILRANDRHITIDEIQRAVCEHYNIRMADMHSARRARSVARPRQVAMSLAKKLTSRSLPEIGRKFGNRDHTTVIHACRKIDELCETDGAIAEDVEMLMRALRG